MLAWFGLVRRLLGLGTETAPERFMRLQIGHRVSAGCAGLLRSGFAIFALAMFAFAAPVQAIEGKYSVEGRDPGGEQPYKGDVEVKQNGQTYAVVWQIGGLRQVGTGVVIDNVFSVVFQSLVPGRGVGRPGVAVYQIDRNRITEGVWTGMGHSRMGQEIWTATDRP